MSSNEQPRNAGCCDASDGILAEGLSAQAMQLASTGFAALWNGKPIDPLDLLPASAEDGRNLVATLVARGRCQIDADGLLTGIHGLTLEPARHHLVHDGRVRHTWCAFDAVGIPAALQLDAVAHTDCPTCGEPIEVTIEDGRPVDHQDVVLWLPGGALGDLIADFCSAADLYC